MSINETPTDATQTERTTTELQPYKDPQILEQLYIEDGHTQDEIAEFYGIDQSTVSYWLDKHGIEREEPDVYRNDTGDGHIQYIIPGEEEASFYQHQLIACLDPEFTTAEIFGKGGDKYGYGDDTEYGPGNEPVVHHLMAAPFAVDVEENLLVKGRADHMRGHGLGTIVDPPSTIIQFLFDHDPDDYAHFGSQQERLDDWYDRLEQLGGGDSQ